MIVPSIDLQDGQAVQLIGGATKALDAGDARPLARRFGLVGEIAVVDLDAALGQGSNAAVTGDLIDLARCRVGGGIRDGQRAAGSTRGREVMIGTAATPEFCAAAARARGRGPRRRAWRGRGGRLAHAHWPGRARAGADLAPWSAVFC